MELKPPKPKKKSNLARLISWGKMFRTPLLILFLLGTTNCENDSESDILDLSKSNLMSEKHLTSEIDLKLSKASLENSFIGEHFNPSKSSLESVLIGNTDIDVLKSNYEGDNDSDISKAKHLRHRHHRNLSEKEKLSQIRYLRRHLNKEIVNFIMSDVLVDGEVENRVHFNGITAKETYVGDDGNGLRLRQLTDGRHLVQVIYDQNGVIQDCEYITQGKSARNFLKAIRKELKQALNEESFRIMDKRNNFEDGSNIFGETSNVEKFYRHFRNVTFRILKKGENLPIDVASWLNYDNLKTECLKRHEEMKYMMESNNKFGGISLARSRRSLMENFILPGTKWCGPGQLAEDYRELGGDRTEDKCCRAHDNCRVNIGQFKRRFGYFNFRPYTISHCRCDRRFRACLKLADTSVSNMVGKLFFNIVQTKCFILKPVKMCTQRSWWGKCLRRGRMQQAFLRDNLPY